MKALTLLALASIGTLMSNCGGRTAPYDIAITVMVDQTDAMILYPTAKGLLSPFGLERDPFRGVQVRIVAINAQDIAQSQTLSLERENRLTSNSIVRQAKIRRFEKELQACLDTFRRIQAAPRSIIFRAVSREAMRLKGLDAASRVLLVFSDLMELSETSFYDAETLALLQDNPGAMERRLQGGHPLPDLVGLQVWLLYSPGTYQQNSAYMPIAHFYERVYTAHNATVHIDNQFLLP